MPTKLSSLHASRFLILSVIFFVSFLPRPTRGDQRTPGGTASDQEKRSCIQAIDGYAYLSENMTLAQVRAAAFANAKRQALESAKTYLESKTKVKDFQVEYDLLWSSAEGAVTILEQKDLGIEDNSRYHVWVKAEVLYSLEPKKPQGEAVPMMDKDAPLTVKVWTSKKQYRDGELIEISVQGNRDFYARIVDINSAGEIIQLLPNDFRKVSFFEAGRVYKIPDKGDQFDLLVAPPHGEDRIVVYASEVPLGRISTESVGQGLHRYRGNLKSLASSARGITVAPALPGAHSGAEFYEATWTLTTQR